MRIMLKSKIHRARVTRANIDYEGSISIDRGLMEEADILPYEQVQVLNINTFQILTILTNPSNSVSNVTRNSIFSNSM